MRIIDKNYDFYDYLQDPTDTVVFDRRGSFALTKERISYRLYRDDSDYAIVVLQCGVTYWLFLLKFISKNDYEVELLHQWKNYDGDNELIEVRSIEFKGLNMALCDYAKRSNGFSNYYAPAYNYNKIKNHINDMVEAINQHDCDEYILSTYTKETSAPKRSNYYYVREELTIPILSASGLTQPIDPMDVYLAIEEHFSLEKTASEKTVADGTTNNDKIVNHGFDLKTSFRGKA